MLEEISDREVIHTDTTFGVRCSRTTRIFHGIALAGGYSAEDRYSRRCKQQVHDHPEERSRIRFNDIATVTYENMGALLARQLQSH